VNSHPLALACMGGGSAQHPSMDLVRTLVEVGQSDVAVQDSIGDDCAYHARTSVALAKYIRNQNDFFSHSISFASDAGERSFSSALTWAVYDCRSPAEIEKCLDDGADIRNIGVGLRPQTGSILHTATSLLNPLQPSPEGLIGAKLDLRREEIIRLLVNRGAYLYALDDNGITPLDSVLEITRKWRYRKTLKIWRKALESCGIDWESYLKKEYDIHECRTLEEFLGFKDYYWSLHQQRQYWLSEDWEEESEERLFWDPDSLDFLPRDCIPYASPIKQAAPPMAHEQFDIAHSEHHPTSLFSTVIAAMAKIVYLLLSVII
jgi:hypothetical protein